MCPSNKFIAASAAVFIIFFSFVNPLVFFFSSMLIIFKMLRTKDFLLSFPESKSFSSSSDPPITSFILSPKPLVESRFSSVFFEVLSSSSSDKMYSNLLFLSQFQFWPLQSKEFLLFFQHLVLFFSVCFLFYMLFFYSFPTEMIFR